MLFLTYFSAEVKALSAIWFVGDNFLQQNFHALQTLKTEATIKKLKLPYIYQYYNLSAWFCKQIQSPIPTIAKIQNALVAALNEYPHMPHYIVIVPYKDICTSINDFLSKIDCGAKEVISDNVYWLLH